MLSACCLGHAEENSEGREAEGPRGIRRASCPADRCREQTQHLWKES